MIDIRLEGLRSKLGKVKRILVICSAKGGVGKSTLTFLLASVLSRKYKIGVWDMDLTGPSLHLLFKTNKTFIEKDGIVPPEIYRNIFFMSIVMFSKDDAISLRGKEITDAILEISAITNWGEIEYLLIDTPPTITDTFLDVIRYISEAEFLVVSTHSVLSFSTVLKMVKILEQNQRKPRLLFLNQIFPDQKSIKINNGSYEKLLRSFEKVVFIPFVKNIEDYYGRVDEVPKISELKEFIDSVYKIF
ncbi:MAG: P-loop NTPase [Candidatus Calescibacterium sp.]|nr:P-loop NTPase [Candidatus Calescibacterium sp.]MCX7733455.1 P-loop NTPase [bacterium]MDW8087436.1 P-loop NTPase [Candidatus Calescibacterium sp.]